MAHALLRLVALAVALAPASGWADAAGTLNPDFGVGGRALSDADSFDGRVTTLPDGRMLVISSTRSSRYLADGSLDTSFGPGGDGVGGGVRLAVQPSGKVLRLSDAFVYEVCRYAPNGTLDTSFGSTASGCLTGAAPLGVDEAVDLLMRPDGSFVVVSDPFTGTAVASYLVDGAVDTSFGSAGVATSTEPQPLVAIQQSDGAIVVGGFTSLPSGRRFSLARFGAAGALDATFGSGGVVTSATTGSVTALAVQADGKILAGGSYSGSSGVHDCLLADYETYVFRYDTTGTLDPAFGTAGVVTDVFDFLGGGGCGPWTLAVQSDGKILAGGGAKFRLSSLFSLPTFALTRLLTDGSLDATFQGGTIRTDIPNHTFFEQLESIAVQADGSIVGAGSPTHGLVSWFGGTCGNGTLEAGEDCDDGNLTGGDGCDANCCVLDTDGDGSCDAIDPCTTGAPITNPFLLMTGFATPLQPDKFKAKGEFVLPVPFAPAVDPSLNGVRIVLEDSSGTLLDVTVDAAPFDGRRGWKAQGVGRWSWVDRARNTSEGLSKLKVKAFADTGQVKFSVLGKRAGFYKALAQNPPVTLTVVLDVPTAAGGQCGRIAFAPAACVLSASALRCQ